MQSSAGTWGPPVILRRYSGTKGTLWFEGDSIWVADADGQRMVSLHPTSSRCRRSASHRLHGHRLRLLARPRHRPRSVHPVVRAVPRRHRWRSVPDRPDPGDLCRRSCRHAGHGRDPPVVRRARVGGDTASEAERGSRLRGRTGSPLVGEHIGARTLRVEDPRLVTGRGRYVDDIRIPGILHAAFVRSNVAHGRIRSVDVARGARRARRAAGRGGPRPRRARRHAPASGPGRVPRAAVPGARRRQGAMHGRAARDRRGREPGARGGRVRARRRRHRAAARGGVDRRRTRSVERTPVRGARHQRRVPPRGQLRRRRRRVRAGAHDRVGDVHAGAHGQRPARRTARSSPTSTPSRARSRSTSRTRTRTRCGCRSRRCSTTHPTSSRCGAATSAAPSARRRTPSREEIAVCAAPRAARAPGEVDRRPRREPARRRSRRATT